MKLLDFANELRPSEENVDYSAFAAMRYTRRAEREIELLWRYYAVGYFEMCKAIGQLEVPCYWLEFLEPLDTPNLHWPALRWLKGTIGTMERALGISWKNDVYEYMRLPQSEAFEGLEKFRDGVLAQQDTILGDLSLLGMECTQTLLYCGQLPPFGFDSNDPGKPNLVDSEVIWSEPMSLAEAGRRIWPTRFVSKKDGNNAAAAVRRLMKSGGLAYEEFGGLYIFDTKRFQNHRPNKSK